MEIEYASEALLKILTYDVEANTLGHTSFATVACINDVVANLLRCVNPEPLSIKSIIIVTPGILYFI